MNIEKAKEVAPCIFIYENVLDNCEQVVDLAKKSYNKMVPASIAIDNENSAVDTTIRNTMRLDLPPTFANDIEWFALSQKIWAVVNNYAIHHNVYFSNMEIPQFLSYFPGVGFYSVHADDSPKNKRVISVVLYLNDVKEGGETYFDKFNISVKPKKGRMVVFPSNYAYTHEAKIPISNEKNVVVTWFNP